MLTFYLDLFRQQGLGNFRELLVELSKHPAMVFYLDNCENHKGSINENYGRELLELFSLGVGMDGHLNYSEDDVKPLLLRLRVGTLSRLCQYSLRPVPMGIPPMTTRTTTTVSGPSWAKLGRWNGEGIIDSIVRQPATARFISRHLYTFFVADEPQVPAWKDSEPRDVEAIRTLEKAFTDNNYEIRAVLRTLFNSDFFKKRPIRQDKEPGRGSGWHYEAGEGPHRGEARPPRHRYGAWLHGARAAEPTHR